MTLFQFRPDTSQIPTEPGVYRYLDERGRVIYVGKAKNLRARLTSYFGDPQKLHERTRRMLSTANDVVWTIVRTEAEALELEFQWIKEFEPPFNVRFRDDKSYPYIAISHQAKVPRIFITRNRGQKGVRYFGPYMQGWAVRETIDTLLRAFPMRSCKDGIFERAQATARPCLLADIGKCSAPCVGRIPPDEHLGLVKDIEAFISHGDEQFVDQLRAKMLTASQGQEYERAGQFRDSISALEKVLAKSTLVFPDKTDADLVAVSMDEMVAAVSFFQVRGGRIRASQNQIMDLELELDAAAVMRWALERFYLGRDSGELGIPKELLVSVTPEDETSLELVLGAKAERRVQIRIPQRGDKRALMETVQKNAENALESYRLKRGNDFLARTDALVGLQHALGMKRAPLRIECFDISHLGGTGVVASMVVFEDGLPRKASYRKFNIQNPIDDTASIYEVTLRRLRQIADDPEGSIVPDLILVDGGEPQLHAAQKAAANYPNLQIPIASLAKRLEELWSGDSGYPILLPRASEELFLVQRIRDEAHRFAIAAQRAKRSSQIGTALMDISGLGESRSRALIRRFGSLARLKVATLEEIQDVPGIGRALAETIHGTLNP